jgi:GINS complex subunit 2
MALPLPPGLTPPEIAFLCEMELVTVIPRQRLERLELLGVSLPRQHPHKDYMIPKISDTYEIGVDTLT